MLNRMQVIIKMSVDVFGRKLRTTEVSNNRGPPGIGYKLTSDGQYDLENKRLCNVAEATQPNDAVNLNTLHKIIYGLQKDLENLEKSFEAYRKKTNESLLSTNNRINVITNQSK